MTSVYFNTDSENIINFSAGGNSKYYLDLIVDEITSCLNSNAISYNGKENSPENAVGINLKMENTSPNQIPGIKITFPNGNPSSSRLSNIIFENMKAVYFDPSNVRISADNETNGDNKTYVTITFENPENPENILWIRQNIETIAQKIIMSLTEFFGLPYVPCSEVRVGIALKDESIRSRPSLNSPVIESTKAGSKVNVLGQWEDWYIIGENNKLGYIQTQFIEV